MCERQSLVSPRLYCFWSRTLYKAPEKEGVQCQFIDVPGEGHTFVGKMTKGSMTWELQFKGFDFLESVTTR